MIYRDAARLNASHCGVLMTSRAERIVSGMDATYKSDLREMNELNFARFDAKLEQRVAEIRAEMHVLKADLIKWMFLFFAGSALASVLLS